MSWPVFLASATLSVCLISLEFFKTTQNKAGLSVTVFHKMITVTNRK